MNVFRRVGSGIIAALVMLFGTLVASSPAQAALNDCPSSYFCLWSETNYSGVRYQWSAGYIWQQPGHVHVLTGAQDNNMASMYNRTGSYIVISAHDSCFGTNVWRTTPGTYSNLPSVVRNTADCIYIEG